MGERGKKRGMSSQCNICEVCGNDLAIKSYFDQGDLIFCNTCFSEYFIHRRYPVKLMLFEESWDEDAYRELDFN